MAVYAIGDIQGCYDELRELLTHIKFKSDRDQLWFCGDIVNRGPKSLKTLRFIRSLEENANTVLGNHDLHLLATAYDHRKPGRKDTLDKILLAKDSEQLLDWLRHRPLVIHDEKKDVTLFHAGIHPAWNIKKTLKLANEVEQILQSDRHIYFYKNMYGDKPASWNDSLSGWPRYRFITNILTRLRYCDIHGRPALNAKGAPGSQAKHLMPWYEVPNRKTRNDTLIFGHWSTLPHAGRKPVNNTYAIDSGCLWGGYLTAMKVGKNKVKYTRMNCPGAQKPTGKFIGI